MKEIIEELKEREKYLRDVIEKLRQNAQSFPEGALRCTKKGNRILYYHRLDPKNTSGKYIRKQDVELAYALAQKDYNHRILTSAEHELNAISSFRKKLPKNKIEEIYDNLSSHRQKLITPIVLTNEQYAKEWESAAYIGKGVYSNATDYLTDRGEYVRSKSELIIANQLYKAGIPYKYECPINLKGLGRIFPDFTLLHVRKRKELYWEHMGMMDDPDYCRHTLDRIACYEMNGIFPGEKLILTHETSEKPISIKLMKGIIAHYFD